MYGVEREGLHSNQSEADASKFPESKKKHFCRNENRCTKIYLNHCITNKFRRKMIVLLIYLILRRHYLTNFETYSLEKLRHLICTKYMVIKEGKVINKHFLI